LQHGYLIYVGLNYTKKESMIKQVKAKHGTFNIFEDDIFVSRCLELYGEWSEGEIDIYKSCIGPDDVVIEVGSHIGAFTVPISKLAKVVYTFEPQRTVFQVLNSNLVLNDCRNVYAYMMAIGQSNDLKYFKEVDYGSRITKKGFNSGAVQLKQIETEKNGYPCYQARLDDLIPTDTPVHFMKVDAETMETQVLSGASALIKKNRPMLYLESNPGEEELIRFVKNMGYKVFEHKPLGWSPDNFNKNQTQILTPRNGNIYDYMLFCFPAEKEINTNLKEL
tara:strand:- start:4790 stop:5623 length:834 start_codon:yes stop_codon:yes gene_type:complete